MKSISPRQALYWYLTLVLLYACGPHIFAEPIAVHYPQGTLHGYLVQRSEDGHLLASGEVFQYVRGDQVTSRTTFHFKDGSIDDETTVFSQRRTFQLITDHRIQKGPFFPHPMDVLVDCRSSKVTVRSIGKDGKEEVKTDHLTLPLDLSNGLVPIVLANISTTAPETTVSMVVATPKPRIIKLVISPSGQLPFTVTGSSGQAIHFEIKIDLGGIAAVVAPLIGKQPPNIQAWIVGGQAPSFVREQGPLYTDGPVTNIVLTSPVWADLPKTSD